MIKGFSVDSNTHTYYDRDVAVEFSTASTYEVNDYVIRDDNNIAKLYKCHTAVASAGAWTGSSNWIETTVGAELKALASGSGPPVTGDAFITFSSPSEFTLGVYHSSKTWFGTLEYSIDKENWVLWEDDISYNEMPMVEPISSGYDGEKYVIYLRGKNNAVISDEVFTGGYLSEDPNPFVLTGDEISCTGNIENILDYRIVGLGFHPAMGKGCFKQLFYGCETLVEAPTLPSPFISMECYQGMFKGCTSLATAPSLPALTLAPGCYASMFEDCYALTSAPELPATRLSYQCYLDMFQNCDHLEQAPELPAEDLSHASQCYSGMFMNCTALTVPPALPATIISSSCYSSMFRGCWSLTTLPELPAQHIYGYENMFEGSSIMISETQSEEYPYPYRIPPTGTGTEEWMSTTDMFSNTWGEFTGTPELNTTYYTNNPPIAAS